ncbi:tRNA (guanosine(46)-N7)-methyltransferase TrmB [Mycoplasma todarodis]|uniref:tRNA (guanine-N(7)-)-methyltransferase n=1 Tax=Mycoplasma todarodis TaxID=1937191 RepID=A0A4R0XXS8_9MOLU|nr:tRNA (guanosine(46)-N7)-methyltransferase TrmB [Mycoplasma todarodis]TCG11845.1 tRNA (guanosine(46)-N7)-methyltransferase TrmB [Mycoplasma todarodis]
MRLRNNPNAQVELDASKYTVKEYPFKVNKNVIIELGMGKGEMITQLAAQNPDKYYVGIEKFATVAHKAMKRAEKLELDNFSIIDKDIKDLPELIEGTVETIWLTFSDPWPKARHEKRRLTYKSFLDHYKNILSEDGVINMKTDNDKLFLYSLESMQEYGMEILAVTRDFHNSKWVEGNVMTGYEKKWSESGKNINFLRARFK